MIWLLTIALAVFLGVSISMVSLYFHRAYYKANGWAEGYWTGVADQQTAADVNEPGYGPARINPYRDWRTGLPLSAKEMWGQWRGARRAAKHRRSWKRMEKPKSPLRHGMRAPVLPPRHGGYRPQPPGSGRPLPDPKDYPKPPKGPGGGSKGKS